MPSRANSGSADPVPIRRTTWKLAVAGGEPERIALAWTFNADVLYR